MLLFAAFACDEDDNVYDDKLLSRVCVHRVPEKKEAKMFSSYLLENLADSDKIRHTVSSVNLRQLRSILLFHLNTVSTLPCEN